MSNIKTNNQLILKSGDNTLDSFDAGLNSIVISNEVHKEKLADFLEI